MQRLTFADIPAAAAILKRGGLVAFPTETVYGLGCRFDDCLAYDRLVSVKRRPADKPFTMMLADPSRIGEYALVDARQQRLIARFMPGEVTFILKRRNTIPDRVALGGPTIGIRVPAHPDLLERLRAGDVPLLVPSCNRSGEPPAPDADAIERIFHDEIDAVIDGPLGDSIPSTVVLLTGAEPKILRQGKVAAEAIMREWNREE